MKTDKRDERYLSAAAEYGRALERLARGYEADRDQRQDLLQEIHLALWRSMTAFDGRCSERTWVYRVAHNAAATYVARQRRTNMRKLATLEELTNLSDVVSPEDNADAQQALVRLTELVRALNPLDKQVMLLYLEDLDAAGIGEITGLSAGAVATKVHRIKTIIGKRLQAVGGHHGA
jgi:RNA polymerase sigma-70 factor (ECF subfamily)